MSLHSQPKLYMLCGKIAAGKSTLSTKLATRPHTVAISEDAWLARLYKSQISNFDDYVFYSAKLRDVVGPHVEDMLRAGLSVVLDFPANTRAQRRWMRQLCINANAAHELHFLDTPDEVCRQRLKARNLAGAHNFVPTTRDYGVISGFFESPHADEGFEVIRHELMALA